MSTHEITMSALSDRYPNHYGRARLCARGYMPTLDAMRRGVPTGRSKPEHEMIRALHNLSAVCLFLVGKFLLRPVQALLAYIRPRAAAGEMMAFTAEPLAHELMLGLFTIPGLRWSLALVMQGQAGHATAVLAAKVVRLDHDQIEAARERGEQARLARARGTFARFAMLAMAAGGRS
jgi:hypothetical protein